MNGDFRMVDQSDGVSLMSVKMSDFERVLAPDNHSEPDWLTMDTGDKAVNAQYARALEAYNRGEWHLIGLYVRVDIYVPLSDKTATVITLQSPGLWGIEDGADTHYLDDIYAEECSPLADICTALGVKVEAGAVKYRASKPRPRTDTSPTHSATPQTNNNTSGEAPT